MRPARAAGLVAGIVVATGAIGSFPALAAPPALVPASDPPEPVFRFRDPRIHESSGLVDLGRWMVTANDSGDTGRLFVVDPRTGDTVGVVRYAEDPEDVEALAPAGPQAVWVGDIGDNPRHRSSITVHRVPVSAGDHDVPDPERYRLAYPGPPHDAESLFADRRGRLYVVTKSFTGGLVYRAPYPLRTGRVNALVAVGRVDDYATGAALLPDGRHVLVRGPVQASVYRLADLARVGTFDLPRQRQGEAISVGPGGRLRVSSEGVRSPVYAVALPAAVRDALRPGSPAASEGPAPQPPRARAPGSERSSTWVAWLVGGLAAALAVVVGWVLRRSR